MRTPGPALASPVPTPGRCKTAKPNGPRTPQLRTAAGARSPARRPTSTWKCSSLFAVTGGKHYIAFLFKYPAGDRLHQQFIFSNKNNDPVGARTKKKFRVLHMLARSVPS